MLLRYVVLGSLVLSACTGGALLYKFGVFTSGESSAPIELSQVELSRLSKNAAEVTTKLPSNARRAVGLLKTKCVRCHHGEELAGGLDLTSHASLLTGGDSGAAVDSESPAASLLIERISDVESPMPPEGEGKPLTAPEKALLAEWLKEGAPFPNTQNHWAFAKEPLGAPYSADTSIDSLLAQKRKEHGIASADIAGRAGRRQLIQRLYLNLTGLPPSAAELDRHSSATSAEWYSELVDELLDSPRFGVRWAQLWLDLARYADSDGFEKDLVRPDAWRYRQWVVDALNAGLPFDQFSKWQIAGDCFSDASLSQRLATGFLRCAPANREGGTDPKKNDFERDVDRLNAFGTIWLGISLECAQCHDHPFEPVTQREYYQLLAFIENCENETIFAANTSSSGSDDTELEERLPNYLARRSAIINQWNLTELQTDWEEKLRYTSTHYGEDNGWDNQWLRLQIYIDNAQAILFRDPSQRTIHEQDQLLEFFIEECDDAYPDSLHATWQLDKALEAFDALQAEFAFDKSMVTRPRAKTQPTYLRQRGDFYQPADVVQAGFPSIFGAVSASSASRESLANWLFEDCEMLVARVGVSRVWRELFGQGFVADGADFGVQTEAPVLQELLDFTATNWIQDGWSLKKLIRRIVHSEAYQSGSVMDPAVTERDPSNQFFTRQSRIRLSGEELRDRVLHVGKLLNEAGGRSFFPPQPFGVDKLSFNPTDYWQTSRGEEQYRRSLFIHRQRSALFPFLDLSGGPDGNAPCTFRRVTDSPLKSLALLNEELVLHAARQLAAEVCQAEQESEQRLELMWLSVFCDEPTHRESQLSLRFLAKQKSMLAGDPTTAFQLTHQRGETELAAWTLLGRSLMNTDRFQRRE